MLQPANRSTFTHEQSPQVPINPGTFPCFESRVVPVFSGSLYTLQPFLSVCHFCSECFSVLGSWKMKFVDKPGAATLLSPLTAVWAPPLQPPFAAAFNLATNSA